MVCRIPSGSGGAEKDMPLTNPNLKVGQIEGHQLWIWV
jgi:hypothetical protein